MLETPVMPSPTGGAASWLDFHMCAYRTCGTYKCGKRAVHFFGGRRPRGVFTPPAFLHKVSETRNAIQTLCRCYVVFAPPRKNLARLPALIPISLHNIQSRPSMLQFVPQAPLSTPLDTCIAHSNAVAAPKTLCNWRCPLDTTLKEICERGSVNKRGIAALLTYDQLVRTTE